MSPLPVAVFGEVLADVFPDQSVLGGAPFNVARHLQAFGLNPLMISRVGQDALGAALLEEMSRLGMSLAGMQRDTAHPTGMVQVTLENGGHRFEILPDQAYDYLAIEMVRQVLTETRPRLAYFGTLAQRAEKSREALAGFISECECTLFLDVNLRMPWYDIGVIENSLHAADIVKLNDEELVVIAAMFGLENLKPEVQVQALQQRFALQQVVVTCGAAGSWLLDQAGRIKHIGPVNQNRPLVDTVGAGDAYSAVIILGLLHGWDVMETLQRASNYAAAICTIRGAVPEGDDFFEPYRQAWGMVA